MVDKEFLECAICFESVAESTVLPCSCKIDYCGLCWNKALASSFNTCGFARCPSCRGPVRVSFNADANRLVFSRETESVDVDEEDNWTRTSQLAERAERTIERIAREAMPAQIRILKEFGMAHSLLGDVIHYTKDEACKMPPSELKGYIAKGGGDSSGCLEKSDLVECLLKAVEKEAFVSMVAVAKLPPPTCVCGSSLVWLDGKSRLRRQIPVEQVPDAAFDDLYASTLRSGIGNVMICDLCDGPIAVNASVWTCENGSGTILHATSYDICPACFSKHSCENVRIGFSESFAGEL